MRMRACFLFIPSFSLLSLTRLDAHAWGGGDVVDADVSRVVGAPCGPDDDLEPNRGEDSGAGLRPSQALVTRLCPQLRLVAVRILQGQMLFIYYQLYDI